MYRYCLESMMFGRFKGFFVIILAVLFLTIGVAHAEPITIRFSHVVGANTPKGQMAARFKELVDKRLSGKVAVEVYANGELFGDDKVLEAMSDGKVEIAAPSLAKLGQYSPKLAVFDLPFLFKGMDAVEKFQKSEAGQKLLLSLQDKGFVGLGYLHNGFKQLSATTPLRVPKDARGLKFRIMDSDILAEQFLAIGAIPLKEPFSRLYNLLKNREVDGCENSWSNICTKRLFEVQPYITVSNHGLLDYLVVSSAEFWLGLPDDVRAEVQQALDEAIVYGNRLSERMSLYSRKKVEASKRSEIIEISEEERALWVEAMKPVWKSFEGDIGTDIIEAAHKANL